MFKIVLIATGGFLGAVCRMFLARTLNDGKNGKLPYGTLAANLFGSFILGYLIGLAEGGPIYVFFGIGFTGALTTFSTLMLEIHELTEQRKRKNRNIYMAVSVTVGLVLAFAGIVLGRE